MSASSTRLYDAFVGPPGGVLIASLMAADLIDEYLLFIHSLVLGSGRRLFPEGVEVALRLVHGVITPAAW